MTNDCNHGNDRVIIQHNHSDNPSHDLQQSCKGGDDHPQPIVEILDDEELLIQYLGLEECSNPRRAPSQWDVLHDLLSHKPHLAKIACGKNGIYFPINLALCNEEHPVPAHVVELFLQADSTLLTSVSFELACSNPRLSLSVLDVILSCKQKREELLTHWSLRQVAFYENKHVAKYIMERYPHVLPKVCGDWAMIYGNSVQTFWLGVMLDAGCEYVSEDHVIQTHLLHYMTSQSNFDAVQLLVRHYPRALSVKKQGRLPLHEALSNYSGRVYGWHSNLVLYLLEKGYENHVGGEEYGGGLGGLFVPDQEGNTPLESALQLIRYLSFSKDLIFGERWNCLLQCIHFAHEKMGGHMDDSIFLKSLGIIPFAADIIDYIVDKYGVDHVDVLVNGKGQKCMEIVIDAITQESPIRTLAKKTTFTRQIFANLLGNRYPGGGKHLARIRDASGRLPLVHAVTAKLNWNDGVSRILSCHPLALEEMDSVSGLYLFMVAAACDDSGESGRGGDLNACYELLRRYPNVAVCHK